MGLEPTTSSLGSWHSTTELLPLNARCTSENERLVARQRDPAGNDLQKLLLTLVPSPHVKATHNDYTLPLFARDLQESENESSVSVRTCSGEFTSPNGGVKAPLRQTETLPKRGSLVRLKRQLHYLRLQPFSRATLDSCFCARYATLTCTTGEPSQWRTCRRGGRCSRPPSRQ